MEGTVFNIQRYSIDDGPGIRSTVFLKGCPLSCLWCSNPESQNPLPEVSYRYTSCKRCASCVKACPNGLISLGEDGIHIDRKRCERCGKCIDACVPEALKMSGKIMTVDEVFGIVKRDIDFYKSSNGGVTCSGGEILSQADFTAELFKRCREEGINNCADTSGYGTPEAMEKILQYSDLIYFDLKHMDSDEHERMCGLKNDLILTNLSMAAKKGVRLVIRVPLIPGYTDSEENLKAIAKAVIDITGDKTPVSVLPYHRYGANKYRMIDREYPLEDVTELTEGELEKAKRVFESFGIKCEISK